MNAKYYECVNERRKKNSKRVMRVETTTLGLLVYLLYRLHHHILLRRSKFFYILKVNYAQFKHTIPKCGRQEGNLRPLDFQPSALSLLVRLPLHPATPH